MNKAFVRENDDADDDDDLEPEQLKVPGGKNYITRAGYQALRDELSHLLDVERPEVVQVVSWAASNGDRVEEGQLVAVLEAMKMEKPLLAPRSGVVTGLGVSQGDTVGAGSSPRHTMAMIRCFSGPPSPTASLTAPSAGCRSSVWTRRIPWPARSAGSRRWRVRSSRRARGMRCR